MRLPAKNVVPRQTAWINEGDIIPLLIPSLWEPPFFFKFYCICCIFVHCCICCLPLSIVVERKEGIGSQAGLVELGALSHYCLGWKGLLYVFKNKYSLTAYKLLRQPDLCVATPRTVSSISCNASRSCTTIRKCLIQLKLWGFFNCLLFWFFFFFGQYKKH